MLKTIASIASALLFGASLAHAQAPAKIDLLTENFPPYNMAADGKNFARDENISGIAVDIVREMFKRAGVDYTLTLRFPWERIYKVSVATQTVNMAWDPEDPSANRGGRELEAVTKDQLNTGLTGQIRYQVSEKNLYAYLFGVKNPTRSMS